MASYRLLTTEKMSSLSQAWLARKELAEIPQTNGILANIESAHKGLAQTISAVPPLNQQLRALTIKIMTTDNRHDNLLRMGYSHFTTLIAYAAANDDAEREAEYHGLRKFIYEKGLGGTVLPFDEQEGAALRLEGRFTKAVKVQLASIKLHTGVQETTLLAIVEEQISLAKEIRALEKQKRILEGTPDDSVKPIDLRRARLAWLEATRALENNLKLAVQAKAATSEKAQELLAELHEAEAEAYKEYVERKKQEALQAAKEIETPP
jgi:hypothetical protein